MLDLIVYTGVVVLFILGTAPVVLDMLREYREIRAKRSQQ